MRFAVVTLFPELIQPVMQFGVVGRAMNRGLIDVQTVNPRDFATDAHKTVDDRPYGGGPGMVFKPDTTVQALRAAKALMPSGSLTVYLGADGEPLTQARVKQLHQLPGLVLLAGRYEGVDERVLATEVDMTVSIGDYVLSGGELPALVMIDAITRLIPGALGDTESAGQDSFENGLLDWPHYTRPEVFEGRAVPPVLLSGNHAAIRRWRLKQALGRTWQRRPELLSEQTLNEEQRELLQEFKRELASSSSAQV
jgi:tRNA (guanine37-N1)-methyltransferase